MDLAARTCITAGVALASAVLAAVPVGQHLPDLRLARDLPQVSVSDVQLADAASGVMDLFAGVENELASLAHGAAAAALPAPPTGLPLSIQTWVDTFATAGTNLQAILNKFNAIPFPALQQIAANGIAYGNLYVGTFHTAAAAAAKYFLGSTATSFGPIVQTGFTQLASSNVQGALLSFYTALYVDPLLDIAFPLEKILTIPEYITANLAAATKYLMTTGVSDLGVYAFEGLPTEAEAALGASLQAVSNAYASGNLLEAASNLVNTPGAVANAFLNGYPTFGLLSNPSGLLNTVLNVIAPAVAKTMVAPGAVNITTGGSLQGAFQGFVNQLVNGWPALGSYLTSSVPAQLASVLQSIPSVLSNLPSIVSNFGGLVASNIGLLISNLLKLL